MFRFQLFKHVVVLVIVALLGVTASPAFAQTETPDVPHLVQEESTNGLVDGESPDGEPAAHGEVVEKGQVNEGESSSVESGRPRIYIPHLSSPSAVGSVAPAATDASWRNVFYDELCAYPNAWSRRDYNGTGHSWVYRTVDGLCTMRPSGYTLKMNVQTERTFSLVGALDARAVIRFSTRTEQNYDYLRIEYSCDSRRTWIGGAAYSGSYGWSTVNISLAGCRGSSSVTLRLSFITDQSIIGSASPVVDYVRVQSYR